jgi:hypothetical protein
MRRLGEQAETTIGVNGDRRLVPGGHEAERYDFREPIVPSVYRPVIPGIGNIRFPWLTGFQQRKAGNPMTMIPSAPANTRAAKREWISAT